MTSYSPRPRHTHLLTRTLLTIPLLACLFVMTCCETAPPANLNNPDLTSYDTAPPPSTYQPVPARYKPRVLGPLNPALIALPASMREPNIRVRISAESPTPPVIAAGKYRGRVDILRLDNGRYIAVNTLPIEAYLQGVLAKELYGSWQLETYCAQAIAARTFALYQISTEGRTRPYDVANDESSQMYAGIAGETAKSRQAVADTRGQLLVLTHGRQLAIFCAYYSACIGGASQDPADAWGDYPVPTLTARNVGNLDQACSKFTWAPMSVAKTDLSRCIANWAARNNLPQLAALGPIRTVHVGKRNPATNRPTEIILTDTRGYAAAIRAEEFRLALVYDPAASAPKPPSSNFDIRNTRDTIQLVNGHGYGHGIGLSQWGAQALALQGHDHRSILGYYYPSAALHQAW